MSLYDRWVTTLLHDIGRENVLHIRADQEVCINSLRHWNAQEKGLRKTKERQC